MAWIRGSARVCVAMVLVLAVCAAAWADGCFLPPVAVEKLPEIPRQRAFLSHRDGVETLVVASSLESEGQTFGWVLPVPATPTAFAEASPGFLKTLDLAFGPEVVTVGGGKGADLDRSILIAFAVLVTLWAALGVWLGMSRPVLLGGLLALLVFIGFVIAIPTTMGASKAAGAPPGAGVEVEAHAFVGHYEVTTLRAETPEALQRWLTAQELNTLPPAGTALAQAYIDDGWRFVVARLGRTEGAGPMTPHPLAVTFPAAELVYPMRLTALPGNEVLVELFVAADGRRGHPAMETIVSDRLRIAKRHALAAIAEPSDDGVPPRIALGGFEAESLSQVYCFHPAAKDHLWAGATLTRLRGRFAPEAMKDDLVLRPEAGGAVRKRLYTERAVRTLAFDWAVTAWILGLPILLCACRLGLKAENGRSWFLGRRALPLLVVCGMLWAGVRVGLPTTDARLGSRLHYWEGDASGYFLRQAAEAHLDETHPGWEDEPVETLTQWLTVEAGDDRILAPAVAKRCYREENPYTGGPVLLEDSPGNMTLLQRDGRTFVVWYGESGLPNAFSLPED